MVQSVERAVGLLEVLDGAAGEGLALGVLAARTGLKAPTAHNLLQTLVALGYATHDEGTRRYHLGRRAWALGRRRYFSATLARVAQPVLNDLQTQLGETVLLALFRDGLRHTVASVESTQDLRVGGQVGVDAHLYATATGRMLLSRVDPKAFALFVSEHGLPGPDWPGVGSAAELRDALAAIRRDGFVRYERPGGHVRAVAVPVPFRDEDANVALGTYYPTIRPPAGGSARLRRVLSTAATAITGEYERRLQECASGAGKA